MRGPFEGALNVVRFNWPKYAVGVTIVVFTGILCASTNGTVATLFLMATIVACTALMLPLIASHLIYDRSQLYDPGWLRGFDGAWKGTVVNINAGFDETSALIGQRLPNCTLHTLDFYDPEKHTEPSIERARKARAPFPGTRAIALDDLPCADGSVDLVIAFLSLHEMRDANERIIALKEVRRILKPDGQLIVTEHLRDAANFIAFNFGSFHFHSKGTWLNAFDQAGFKILRTQRITAFITTYTLRSK